MSLEKLVSVVIGELHNRYRIAIIAAFCRICPSYGQFLPISFSPSTRRRKKSLFYTQKSLFVKLLLSNWAGDFPYISNYGLRRTYYSPQSTYIQKVPQSMSPRRNWDSPTLSLASECASPPGTKGGRAHLPVSEGLGESQFRRLEKSLAVCLFCGTLVHSVNTVYSGWQGTFSGVTLFWFISPDTAVASTLRVVRQHDGPRQRVLGCVAQALYCHLPAPYWPPYKVNILQLFCTLFTNFSNFFRNFFLLHSSASYFYR